MPTTPSIRIPSASQESKETASEMGKAIRADAFDHFIEVRLQKDQVASEQSESDVVCHVY